MSAQTSGNSCLTGIYFGGSTTEKNGIPEDLFFPVFSGGFFHRNVVLEEVPGNSYFRLLSQDVFAGIPAGPVFAPDSSGFLFPPKAVWLRPATK